jgi:hypothetical protein
MEQKFSIGNLVFKKLENKGYIDNIIGLVSGSYNKYTPNKKV